MRDFFGKSELINFLLCNQKRDPTESNEIQTTSETKMDFQKKINFGSCQPSRRRRVSRRRLCVRLSDRFDSTDSPIFAAVDERRHQVRFAVRSFHCGHQRTISVARQRQATRSWWMFFISTKFSAFRSEDRRLALPACGLRYHAVHVHASDDVAIVVSPEGSLRLWRCTSSAYTDTKCNLNGQVVHSIECYKLVVALRAHLQRAELCAEILHCYHAWQSLHRHDLVHRYSG